MTRFLRGVSFFLGVGFFLMVAASARAADATTYWIEPCAAARVSCKPGDMELARWALAAWENAAGGKLHYLETRDRSKALLRIFWADRNSGLYGETVPILVNGQYGSELHILTEDPPGQDPLLRDTIVYLTCLHEAGHALGLGHTREFADIMYSFQYGGDIPEYFGRYRRKLTKREDIRNNPGMSPADREALLQTFQRF